MTAQRPTMLYKMRPHPARLSWPQNEGRGRKINNLQDFTAQNEGAGTKPAPCKALRHKMRVRA